MTNSEPKKNKINSLVRTCRLLARMNRGRPETRQSETMYYQMLADYYTRILDAQEEGKFVATHTVFFPTEILYAMGIVPMHTEMTTWLTALFLSEQAELLEAGAELGLVPEICSPHRGVAGIFSLGMLPRPDVVLWSNLICDNTAKCGELLMELADCPGFFLDNPFQDSDLEINYLVGELKDMIDFLEEKSGHKMDWDKLSEIVDRMDKQIELFREICELRKAIPSPLPTQSFLELLSIDYMFPGQPEAIEHLEVLRRELSDMIAEGRGAVNPERFRLMTLFVPPVYLMGFLGRFFQEQGAVSVVEPLFTRWAEGRLDPNKPLESVARKSYLIPERGSMYGPLGPRAIQDVVDCAEQYKVDGAVYWAFMGCRHTCATVKVFKDALNEIDVPVLTVDCDLVDPTINTKEEIGEKLGQFFELLEDR